jgi:hypothetical protein
VLFYYLFDRKLVNQFAIFCFVLDVRAASIIERTMQGSG